MSSIEINSQVFPLLTFGKNICRLCCKTTEPPVKTHEIFKPTGKLKERIQDLLLIELSEDDHDLPKLICDDCFKALDCFHQFRISSVANDEMLRSLPFNNHQLVTFVSTVNSSNCDLQEETVVVDDHSSMEIILTEEVASSPNESNSCVYFQTPSDQCRDADDEAMQLMITWENMSKTEPLTLENVSADNESKMKMTSEENESCVLKCNSSDIIRHPSSSTVLDKNISKKNQLTLKVVEYHCAECNKVFRKRDTFTDHMLLIHLGQNPFKCKICSKLFKRKTCLKKHLRRHKNDWSYVCEHCDRGFIDKNLFDYHVRSSHTNEKPFKCELCSKSYHKKQDLSNHKSIIHDNGEKTWMKCPHCDKKFFNRDAHRHHVKTHIPVDLRRTYKCLQCLASYTGSNGLKKHMLSHTGERPYTCSLCPCKLKSKNGLQTHMLNHSGVKSFVCEFCGIAFASENTLKVHLRRHTGERPYCCKNCEKSFSQLSALRYHEKSCNCFFF